MQLQWATYAVRLRLIRKRVVDFPIMNFLSGCYGGGAKSEYRLKIDVFEGTGPVWPKISVTRGCPHQPFFLSEDYTNVLFIQY